MRKINVCIRGSLISCLYVLGNPVKTKQQQFCTNQSILEDSVSLSLSSSFSALYPIGKPRIYQPMYPGSKLTIYTALLDATVECSGFNKTLSGPGWTALPTEIQTSLSLSLSLLPVLPKLKSINLPSPSLPLLRAYHDCVKMRFIKEPESFISLRSEKDVNLL